MEARKDRSTACSYQLAALIDAAREKMECEAIGMYCLKRLTNLLPSIDFPNGQTIQLSLANPILFWHHNQGIIINKHGLACTVAAYEKTSFYVGYKASNFKN